MSSSTTDGQFRRGTTSVVKFPNLPSLDIQPSRVDLLQAQYTHDILKVRYTNVSDFWFTVLNTGEPVTFQWSRGITSGQFFGYVYLVTKENAAQRKSEMEIQCIGSTFPLKEQVTRVFENMTITDVARIIAVEHGFHFIGETDTRVFEQLVITGQSYWEWLVQQARKIGYAIVVDGLSLIFRPIDKLIDQSMGNIPVLSQFGTALPTNTMFLDRTLDYFKVLSGEHVENGTHHRATKQVGGINPLTGEIISATNSPATVGVNLRSSTSDVLFNEQRTEHVVNSQVAANSAAEGAAHLGRFNMPARVRCQGDTRIRPFAPVFIEGTGELTDGYWMVKSVIHRFAKIGDYQIEMDVVTDGSGKNTPTNFRTSEAGRIGVINLSSAVEVGVYTPNAAGAIDVRLEGKVNPVTQTDRGFLRTPFRWKSIGR